MRQFFLFIIFAAFFTACHRDYESSDTVEIIDTFSPVVYEEINSSITGTVMDIDGNPIQDATVQIYSASTKTNEEGVFIFKDVRADQQGTYIRVQKAGYVLTGDIVYPTKNSYVHTDIIMVRINAGTVINGNSGGVVELGNEGSLTFKPSAFVNKNGQPYGEKVSISTYYINTNDPNLHQKLPGGLRGTTRKGNSVVLGFMGAFSIDLLTDNGDNISIDTTRKILVKFPATTEYRPSMIPLWYFDKISGLWIEEGSASLQGDFYIGEVSKAGFWMLAESFSMIHLSGKIVAQNESTITNASYSIKVKGLNAGYGIVNSQGEFNTKAPKEQDIIFVALPNDGCSFEKSIFLKPLSNDTRLDDVKISAEKPVQATGTVRCDSVGTSQATVVVKIKDKLLVGIPDAQGRFAIDYTLFSCENNSEDLYIYAIGVDGKPSTPIQFTNVSNKGLVVEICIPPCSLILDLVVNCKTAMVNATGGSGNYRYEWQNSAIIAGSSIDLANIDFSTSNLVCVNVIDQGNNNCTKQICKQSIGALSLNFDGGCELNSNLAANPWSGNGLTFTYSWSNGATTKDILVNTPTSSICCTVTDNRGCSAVGCTIAGYDLNDVKLGSCEGSKYELQTAPFTKFFINKDGNNVPFTPGPVIIDIFQYGFELNGTINTTQCSGFWEVSLPQISDNVLNVTSTVSPSCGGCVDGRILYSLNTAGNCDNCSIGTVSLYKTTNLSNNLINNINGNLAAGKYYLCVNDASTGCVIGYKVVEL